MAVKQETPLQSKIQKLIQKRGGYVFKNHGSMIAEPGRSDLTFCYLGRYVSFEVKVGDNQPTEQQLIHLRNVQRAGGFAFVVRSVAEASYHLDMIEEFKS